jgi:hypothetical protein
MQPDTPYLIVPFKCENCGADLEAHTEATGTPQGTFGGGIFRASCPRCNTEQETEFPTKVLRVVERAS